MESYEKKKEELGDAFYAGKNTVVQGLHKDKPEAVDRMVESLQKQIEKREKYSRRRRHDDDAEKVEQADNGDPLIVAEMPTIIEDLTVSEAVMRLEADSKRYAMLMRKYQIETYRNQIPFGGYVVSVIRDFPFAAMGLLDYRGKPKWGNDVWNWHGEQLFVVKTPGDRRSFWADAPFQGKIFLEGSFGAPVRRTEGEGLASTPKGSPPLDLSLRQT